MLDEVDFFYRRKKMLDSSSLCSFPPPPPPHTHFSQEISLWTLHISFATSAVCRAEGKTVILLQVVQ